VFKEKIIRN